ncbi:MAG TPA: type II toxin-antitoxin system RelE/ParE family toxin [Planctomycetaceae bacterium]|jgi:plasmid stabilization system protein ParE|nr:type II toxin-antitoxin system RelE/ParE family toxin [Planctomycetaceae bacterium]
MFSVKLGGRAQADVDHIYKWINAKSARGAINWYGAFLDAAAKLRVDPARHPKALDCEHLSEEIRECFFRTPRGRSYRLLFVIRSSEVRILRVRGPGQPPITDDDC